MHMRDFLLPLNTTGCVCCFQVVKCVTHVRCILVSLEMAKCAQSSNTASSFVRNLGIPKQKLKNGSTALKMAAYRRTVTSVPGDHQRAEMLMSLTKCEH
jgi:hypothetical protein